MKRVLLALISAYRLLLSPFLGANCRFYPTCSMYAAEAIQTHAFRFSVVTQALQILGGQCLDRGLFCLANPTDFKFH